MNRQSPKRDVFVYSNFCHFCKDVMVQIEKYNLKDNFVMVCAETNRHRLPKEIDRVPAIIIDQGSRVIFEDDIILYLQSFSSQHAPDSSLQERVSGCGGMFSYIDEKEDAMLNDAGGYGIFGMEQQIFTPAEDGDTGTGKIGTVNYDRLVSERDMDIKRLMQ